MSDPRKLLAGFAVAALSLSLLAPASKAGLAFHVSSTSAKAISTASSPNPTVKKQQAIADPIVVVTGPVLPFNDATSYFVHFTGTLTWDYVDNQPHPDFVFTGFTADPLNVYHVITPAGTSLTTSSTGGSVKFEGDYLPYTNYTGSGPAPHPSTPVNTDQDFITGNFDDNTIPVPTSPLQVHYTFIFDSLLIYDSSQNKSFQANSSNTSFSPGEAHTGDPDPNLPEPGFASLACLAGIGALMRRPRR